MKQQINLFNPDLFERKSLFSAWALGILAAVGISLLLLIWGGLQWRLSRLQAQEQKSATQVESLVATLNQARASLVAPTHDPAFAQQLKDLQTEIIQREKAVAVLGANKLGNTDGFSEFMAAFARQIPDRVWLTGFDYDAEGQRLSIHGRSMQADLVPLFLNQLKREKVMRGKAFAAIELQRPNAEPGATAQERQKTALAPYIEFEFHTTEQTEKKDVGAK